MESHISLKNLLDRRQRLRSDIRQGQAAELNPAVMGGYCAVRQPQGADAGPLLPLHKRLRPVGHQTDSPGGLDNVVEQVGLVDQDLPGGVGGEAGDMGQAVGRVYGGAAVLTTGDEYSASIGTVSGP